MSFCVAAEIVNIETTTYDIENIQRRQSVSGAYKSTTSRHGLFCISLTLRRKAHKNYINTIYVNTSNMAVQVKGQSRSEMSYVTHDVPCHTMSVTFVSSFCSSRCFQYTVRL